jgi:gamma-glutamyltranspeptidase / glutathione hydrolase
MLLLHCGWSDAAEPYSGTHRPSLHGRHWVALTGKPAGALAGARMFERGGNAIDAACAMLAVVCTMHDDVGWGGETQALIYDPRTKKVVGINACGVAPTGATPEFFKERQQSNIRPAKVRWRRDAGQPGGLMVMLAEFGTLSLGEVLEPAMQMADGYPIEAELVRKIERHAAKLKQWPYSRASSSPVRAGIRRAAPGRNLAATGLVGDAAETGRHRGGGDPVGQRPQGGDLCRLRPVLPG